MEARSGLPLESIRLPPRFHIALYATGVRGARSMTLSPRGTLFVGTRGAGHVYAIPDADHDGVGDRVVRIAAGLQEPNGVALHEGALFVAEVSRIIRFDNIEENLDRAPRPRLVTDHYPTDKAHGWKFIAMGPDGFLYVPIGAPCNICDRGDPYASITRVRPDGTGFEIFARGIRNTVGFDWHPVTKELWFTENGRDEMGDDMPPDEVNRASRPGLHFGFPYCHADVPDPNLGRTRGCAESQPPVARLGPHVAALGMRFYAGTMFPARYQHQILVAEHGSWNRDHKIGYRVMLVREDGHGGYAYEVFADGWLRGEEAWGRPVDVQVAPDGSLLVSDDKADAIYRITYK